MTTHRVELVPPGANVTVSVLSAHNGPCVIMQSDVAASEAIKCWGPNGYGSLGLVRQTRFYFWSHTGGCEWDMRVGCTKKLVHCVGFFSCFFFFAIFFRRGVLPLPALALEEASCDRPRPYLFFLFVSFPPSLSPPKGDSYNRGDDPNEMGGYLAAADLGTDVVPVDLVTGMDFVCALTSVGRVKWCD